MRDCHPMHVKCSTTEEPVTPVRVKCSTTEEPVTPVHVKCSTTEEPVTPVHVKCSTTEEPVTPQNFRQLYLFKIQKYHENLCGVWLRNREERPCKLVKARTPHNIA